MKYFSMFSGIGGFELGIFRSDPSINKAQCVGFSEIDKHAIQIYRKHFKEHKYYGNARDIVPEDIPDIDLLCGGFPCQAFSLAGKRGGFKDTRGTLFFEIARIVAIKRPKLLFLENVAGLLSHDKGRTFGTILATLSELGYFCEWQILNSKDFGVPQNRERVFIIGHFGDGSGRKVFPIQGGNGSNPREITKNQSQGARIYQQDGASVTISSQGGGQGAKTGLYAVPILSKDGKIKPKRIASTLTGGGHSGGNHSDMDLLAIPVLTPDRPEKRQNGRRMKENGDPSFTLTAQDKHGIFDGYRIRRLTPTECERLQGFPDGWTKYGEEEAILKKDEGKGSERRLISISDTQRYKCLGNAVTVNVIHSIMDKINENIQS